MILQQDRALPPGLEGWRRALSGRPAGWPSAPGYGFCVLGHAAGVLEGTAQEHLDLGVQTAQVVGGPAGERIVHGRI